VHTRGVRGGQLDPFALDAIGPRPLENAGVRLRAMRRKGVLRTLTLAAFAVLASALMAGIGPLVAEAAPITPEFAQQLYARVGPLREADGCRVTRFDTSRFQITIGLVTANGTQDSFDLGSLPAPAAGNRTAGEWWLAVPPALARDCATTVAAVERILGETSTPAGDGHVGGVPLSASSHYAVLAWTFALLLLGTVYVLGRETMACAAPWRAVGAFLLVWGVALGLRLTVSPQTFLHEYYHIAETVGAYFGGEAAPGYGRTGPALFRLVRQMLGHGDDVRVIFLTNAVLSSMAVPAVAMLVLAVFRSWPQAICAALLLAVSPQHLRFSAAEDLFVQAITFGLWSLALFASHQRTRRQVDALLGALAASLAMQSRPEMIFFPLVVVGFLFGTERRAWRTVLSRPMLVAAVVFAVSIVPHALDVLASMRSGRSPSPGIPSLSRYLDTLVAFDPRITPLAHRVAIVVGAVWAVFRRPGWVLWIVSVYVGFTVFALSIFDNPQFHLRAQNLPTSSGRAWCPHGWRRGARAGGRARSSASRRSSSRRSPCSSAGAVSSASSRISSSSGRFSSATCRSCPSRPRCSPPSRQADTIWTCSRSFF
jgi:hypothetical protein